MELAAQTSSQRASRRRPSSAALGAPPQPCCPRISLHNLALKQSQREFAACVEVVAAVAQIDLCFTPSSPLPSAPFRSQISVSPAQMLRGGGESDPAARQGLLRRAGLASGCGGQRDAQPAGTSFPPPPCSVRMVA